MKKRVAITGSKGCIGTIIREGLNDFDFSLLDIKEGEGGNSFKIDIANEYDRLVQLFDNMDVIIHLAWNFFEDFPKETIDPSNKKMVESVYRAAVEAGVKRVIMASSVHAHDYSRVETERYFDNENPCPDSPYGASKVYMESLGKYYSRYHALEVVCIRFGGVNKNNTVIYEEDPNYDRVLLYKEDCVDLIEKCIEIDKVPDGFQVLTAVSDNIKRVHNIKNFLNWQPKFPEK